MNIRHFSAIIFAITIIITLFCPTQTQTENAVAPYFGPRSISRNAARDLAGTTNYINKDSSPDTVYGFLSVTPEYTHTFHQNKITQSLFGSNLINENGNQVLKISGSQVDNRGPKDLLADYFYLPTDFESTVRFKPVIDNVIIDFGFYLGLDAWKKGVYFWLHAPFSHTRWDININESIIDDGINDGDEGYYTPNVLPRNKLLDNFTAYANGITVENIENITFEQLEFAKMSKKRLVKSRLAEIRTGFGWNFFAEPHYHAGFNGQLAAPTGIRPKGEFLFEPMVGNGHFWELGIGANGHYTFWQNEEETRCCSVYADLNLTHLFRTRQARTFDLKTGGTLSRYMLAMTMNSPATNLQGTTAVPSAQFNNDFLPVANLTTLNVNVSIAIQADLVLMFNATMNNCSFDLGFNYWARSAEDITLRPIESFAEKTYALKGDAHVFGFLPDSSDFVALSATEDRATIHTGTNMPATGSNDLDVIIAASKNPNIDFPQNARTNPTPPGVIQNLLYAQDLDPDEENFINTSVPPVFITMNDLNIDGAQTRASSCKLFTHMSYTWNDKKEWQPYLGIGGEVEWGLKGQHKEHAPCNLSQWGVWIKTGATFK